MRVQELEDDVGRRTLAVVLATGDEAAAGLLAVARERAITGAFFSGIGAFERVTLAFWDWRTKEYQPVRIEEQVEVLALTGNVAAGPDGGPKVHAHVVVSKRDGTAHGGHLVEATVRPTLEVVLTEAPRHLRRRTDAETGLPLLDLGAERRSDA